MRTDEDQKANVMKNKMNLFATVLLLISFLSIIKVDYFRPIYVSNSKNFDIIKIKA